MTSEEKIRTLCNDVQACEQSLAQSRMLRDEAIATAAASGTRMRDLVDITGLTREHLRRIVRASESSEK
jgi:hypothetical protein